jgi:hypothetical protein
VRRCWLKTFAIVWTIIACRAPTPAKDPQFVEGFRGLVDSLVFTHPCGEPLPAVSIAPPSLSQQELCSVVQAAKSRLGRAPANLPHWDPTDTARILKIGVHQFIELSVAGADTLLTVEFDVPGRPRLIRVGYRGNSHQEVLGVVHRGPDVMEGPARLPRDDLAEVLGALEKKVCLTIGDRANRSSDRCEPQVDRATYLQPVRDVFSAAPPIFKAYLCTIDRLYFDYRSPWNASFAAFPDSQTGREYRTIGVRRGVLENKVRYADWATAWTQHWWTGGPNDRPADDPTLPRVELESSLSGPAGTLYHLVAHEVGHLLDRDYGGGLGRRPANKPFEPGEFGYLSWTSPRYMDTSGVVHQAVARDSAFEAVRRALDFDGNLNARLAMMAAAGNARPFDAGALAVESWQPAPHGGIATFFDRLDRSPFTTVFSAWRAEDDWTESFVAMMLPAIARRFDIVTATGTRVRVLTKVLDDASPFAPKRRFIQRAIDRALTDFRARQAASPNPCLAVALRGEFAAPLRGSRTIGIEQ